MALPAKPLADLLPLTKPQQFDYFCEYAKYIEDSPTSHYAIRLGSKTLYSNDTMDLRVKFDRALAVERRRQTISRKKRKGGR